MLDKFQQAAVDALKEHDQICVVAGPGSGKTTTMIEGIRVMTGDFANKEVIALTFTNKAVQEIKHRIGYGIEPRTLHSYCKQQLESLGTRKGFKVKIMNQQQVERIIDGYIAKNNLYIFPGYAYSFVSGNYTILNKVSNRDRGILMQIDAYYQEYKYKNNLYDFTDYPRYLLDKLNQFDVQEFGNYEALFVDEVQDVDPTQLEILRRIKADKKFYIGDPRQAIYQFRGADEEIFDKIKQQGFKFFSLNENYRSYQEIVNYAFQRRLMNEKDLGHEKREWDDGMECYRGEGGSKTFRAIPIEDHPMILCRKNKEVEQVKEYYQNVMTIHAAKGLEFDDVILLEFPIENPEDVNVEFVALTRAKNRLNVLRINELTYRLYDYRQRQNQKQKGSDF